MAGKPASPGDDLRSIGRGLRNLAEKAVGRVQQYMDPNNQLRQILKAEYDRLRDGGKSKKEAVAGVMAMTKAALDDAVEVAEKTPQSTSTEGTADDE